MSRALLGALAVLTAACGAVPADPASRPRPGASALPAASAAGPVVTPLRSSADLARENVARSEAAWAARSTTDLAALYSKDAAIFSWGPGGERRETTAEMVRGLSGFWDGLATVKMRTTRVVAEGDVALAEWVVIGRTKEGLSIGVPGASLMTFDKDGLVIREKLYLDEQTTAMQLGDKTARGRPPAAEPGATEWLVARGAEKEEANAAVALRFYESLASKRGLDAVLAESALYRDLARPEDVVGRSAIADDFARFGSAFPDLRFETTRVIAAKSHVVVEGAWSGTMTGALGSLVPTKKHGSVHFLDVLEIENDQVVRLTSYSNGAELAGAFF